MSISFPVAKPYQQFLIRHQVRWYLALFALLIILGISRNEWLNSGWFVGFGGVIFARFVLLLLDLRGTYNGWVYILDEQGLGIKTGISGSAIPRYWLRWRQCIHTTIDMGHWRDLPSLVIHMKSGRSVTLVYTLQEQQLVLSEVLPFLRSKISI